MWGYGPGAGMMGGWGGGAMAPLGGIVWLLLLALIVVAVVWVVRATVRAGDRPPRSASHSAGLAVLDERYARGEINREDYLQKKRDVLG
jgi:putative membrane protein